MTILFDSSTIVKPASFGRGVLASYPAHRLPCTVSDLEWAAQVFGEISDARDAAMDRELDRRAAVSATLDALEVGYLLPADLAEDFSRTSPVGHPA
jgi:hypothetical protein